ncbi:MAG: ABC transporter permease [Verrucomicrobia bacterium]|nr:ABC transporter permease [Verrucomicrobiota bacterium]
MSQQPHDLTRKATPSPETGARLAPGPKDGGRPAAPEPTSGVQPRRLGRGQDSQVIQIAAIFVICAILIIASRAISASFGSWNEVETIVVLSSFLIVIGFGQGLVILMGGLDLSVGSLITLGGVLTTTWAGAGANAWLLVPVLLVCGFCGLINGFGVTIAKVPPFIMTLASGIVIYSLCLGFTAGTPRGSSPSLLSALMQARAWGVPVVIYFVILFSIAAALLQSRSSYGRSLYAVGTNPAAARIAGLRVNKVIASVYAMSGLCGGIVGMMLVGYSNGATLRMGEPYVLSSIAAVVVGGSSILGGTGRFEGTVGGAILLTTISTIISAVGLEEGWRTVLEGVIIVIALLLLSWPMPSVFRRRNRTQTSTSNRSARLGK